MRGDKRAFTKSLKFKMLLPVILVTLVIVTALTWRASKTYTQTILEKEDAKVQSSFSVAGSAIQEIAESSMQTASDMLLDDSVKRYARGDFESVREQIVSRIMCREALKETIARSPYLHGLLYMRADGSVFGELLKRTYFFEETRSDVFDEISWMIDEKYTRKSIWIGPFDGDLLYQIKIDDYEIPSDLMLGVHRLNNVEYGMIYAIAVIDAGKLTEYLELLTDSNSRVYLANSDGAMIARAGTNVPLESEIWQRVREGGLKGSDQVKLTDSGAGMYMSYQKLSSLDWYLIRELPMEDYDRSLTDLRGTVLRFSAVVLLIALAIYVHWLNGFMETFDLLKDSIVTLRKGKLGAQMEPPFKINEFEIIRSEFNYMSASLARQVDATVEMEHKQLELQMRNLQTQLSPHMIFNSLTAMRWMASMAGADQVAKMLLELSEMLRPVFRDWKNAWTIGEEIDHLHHYISLLQLRYGSHFSIEYDVADELTPMLIPRFTIQPLIENACEHGGVKTLHMHIRAWHESGWIFLEVSDDGRGIVPERLQKIREGIESGDMGGSIGLVNVSSRLHILSKGSSSMKVECPPEGGTIISLRWKYSA